jgi:hypothetical protein
MLVSSTPLVATTPSLVSRLVSTTPLVATISLPVAVLVSPTPPAVTTPSLDSWLV